MLFWGWLWGPLGALLSVPILAATKIVLENIPDLAWIAELADLKAKDQRTVAAEMMTPHERVGFGLGAADRPRRSGTLETLPGFSVRRPATRPPTPKATGET
jgi:hypothetical protein